VLHCDAYIILCLSFTQVLAKAGTLIALLHLAAGVIVTLTLFISSAAWHKLCSRTGSFYHLFGFESFIRVSQHSKKLKRLVQLVETSGQFPDMTQLRLLLKFANYDSGKRDEIEFDDSSTVDELKQHIMNEHWPSAGV